MRGSASALLLVVVVAAFASACRRSLEGPESSMTVLSSDASSHDAIFAPEGITSDAGFDRFVPVGVPRADPDAGTCSPPPGEDMRIVCFGSDPAPYQLYLELGDGGVAPGQCPTMRDFMPVGGERCGYVSCGPLLRSAVSELSDGGALAGDAGTDCCFFVAHVCGV